MHLSTSSSSQRAPGGPWGRIWLLALLVATIALTGYEIYLRINGFRPNIKDAPVLWALTRAQVPNGVSDAVVLVGSSRILYDVVLEEFAGATGMGKPIQLGLGSTTPLPAIEDVAKNTSFNGLLVCGVTPVFFWGRDKFVLRIMPEYIECYEQLQLSQVFEWKVRMLIQQTFALADYAARPKELLKAWLEGHAPRQQPHVVREDRSSYLARVGDFEPMRIWLEGKFERNSIQPSVQQLDAMLKTVNDLVDVICERGGNVVFVRFPSTGRTRQIEEQNFPRSEYWDRLASQVNNAVTIHYEDYPILSGYICPDDSHLVYEDSVKFTRALGAIIVKQLEANAR